MRARSELVAAAVNGVAVTAWRTWVHARNWREHRGRGWQGVAEGSAVGFAVALLILLPSIIRRPLDAPPYVLAYGGLAAIVGLVIACVLRLVAVLVLTTLSRVAVR
jgi:hypothetical protein